MPHDAFDRERLEIRPLAERESQFSIEEIAVDPNAPPEDPGRHGPALDRLARRIVDARQRGAPVVICHGAHLIKNGLGPLLIRLVEEGWLQHVATNGAGSIHDWEFSYAGRSCEDVRFYVGRGQFGIWEETGATLGLALLVGVLEGLGYGESVGRVIAEERIRVPPRAELEQRLRIGLQGPRSGPSISPGAVADLIEAIDTLEIAPGERRLPHPFSHRSIQAACCRQGIPLTVHPGIGQDIIYTHPWVRGGALGRAALADFLIYAETVRKLPGGVYISAGSSVMSPMIFEKSVSMARNLARREGSDYGDFTIAVNDLVESTWDWSKGEPPRESPDYYVRFCKSFSRVGGEMEYFGLDNRVFLTNLYARLREAGEGAYGA